MNGARLCAPALLLLANLAGCAFFGASGDRAPGIGRDLSKIPDAVPKAEPRSKHGNMKTYEVFGKRYYVLDSSAGFTERGIASWYGSKFHGKRTSSGETYDMYAMTAAHKTLPLPTYLQVRNLENGRSIVVRVNDRGPFHANRVVDLSYVAALKLDVVKKGTALVEIRAMDPGGRAAPVETRGNGTAGGQPPKFYIQVGAFANPDNARRLKRKLLALQKPVQINKARVDGKLIHRVRVGPFTDVREADATVARLRQYDVHEHRVTLD